MLEKKKPVLVHKNENTVQISEAVRRRENTVLSILLTENVNFFEVIKQNMKPDDFKDEINKKIAKKLYEELEKGNSNINAILDEMTEEEQNHITEIMAMDFEIEDMEKAIDDIMQSYEKEKLNQRKLEIIELLEKQAEEEQKKELEKELNSIIIKLVKLR